MLVGVREHWSRGTEAKGILNKPFAKMHFFDLTQSKFAHVSKVQKVIYNLKLVWFNQVIFKRKKKPVN